MNKTLIILLLLALAGTVPAVQAQPVIDITGPAFNPGPSISNGGGADSLSGSRIDEGHNTPLDNLIIQAVTAGALSFTTGNFAGTWQFGAGASNGAAVGAISSSTMLLQRFWFSTNEVGESERRADTENRFKEKYLDLKR